MLVFEKHATLLVEEGIQLGDKIINDYAFCSNSLLSARFTGNYEHLGSFHVFSAIRELNFVEVQKITIMFFFYMENLPDLRSTNKLSLEMSFNPSPDPHLPYFKGAGRGRIARFQWTPGEILSRPRPQALRF